MTGLCHRAGGWAATALIVLLAGVAPRAALASCGDYVIFTTAARPSQPLAAGSHEASDLSGVRGTRLPALPRPCHGPSCSGQPTRPPAQPAPVPIHSRGETAALPAASAVALPGERGFPLACDSFAEPLEIVWRIFHPPRPLG